MMPQQGMKQQGLVGQQMQTGVVGQQTIPQVAGQAGVINPYESVIARLKTIWTPQCSPTEALAICNACFAPDCEIIGLDPNGSNLRGANGFLSFYQAWKTSFPDFNWSSLNYAFNGATVYSMGEAQCTFNSPLCGITNTNRSAPFLTCSRYDFNPGTMKIQRIWTFTNYLAFFRSLGVQIPLQMTPLVPFGQGVAPMQEKVVTQAVTQPSIQPQAVGVGGGAGGLGATQGGIGSSQYASGQQAGLASSSSTSQQYGQSGGVTGSQQQYSSSQQQFTGQQQGLGGQQPRY